MIKRKMAVLILGATLSLVTTAFAEESDLSRLKPKHTGEKSLSDYSSGSGLVCDKQRDRKVLPEDQKDQPADHSASASAAR